MIAMNPFYENPRVPETKDCGPMLKGLSELLGPDNDSSSLEDPREVSIAINALLHKAQEVKQRRKDLN